MVIIIVKFNTICAVFKNPQLHAIGYILWSVGSNRLNVPVKKHSMEICKKQIVLEKSIS